MEKIIKFTVIDKTKLAKLENSYAEAFQGRLARRISKERAAEIKYRDFVITY